MLISGLSKRGTRQLYISIAITNIVQVRWDLPETTIKKTVGRSSKNKTKKTRTERQKSECKIS